jgi:hypothetical protein
MEVLTLIQARGYRLSLRPGGIRLTGAAQPPDEVRLLIADNRGALLAFLKAEAGAWERHEASLAAGRVTAFPAHLLDLVHSSLRALLAAEITRVIL